MHFRYPKSIEGIVFQEPLLISLWDKKLLEEAQRQYGLEDEWLYPDPKDKEKKAGLRSHVLLQGIVFPILPESKHVKHRHWEITLSFDETLPRGVSRHCIYQPFRISKGSTASRWMRWYGEDKLNEEERYSLHFIWKMGYGFILEEPLLFPLEVYIPSEIREVRLTTTVISLPEYPAVWREAMHRGTLRGELKYQPYRSEMHYTLPVKTLIPH